MLLILILDSATIDSFELDESDGKNPDEDDTPTDGNAILIEGEDYYFNCTVTADPNVDVTFSLRNKDNQQIITPDEVRARSERCMSGQYTEQFHLEAQHVTHEKLECGYLRCSANGQMQEIYFRVISKLHIFNESLHNLGVFHSSIYSILQCMNDAYSDLNPFHAG